MTQQWTGSVPPPHRGWDRGGGGEVGLRWRTQQGCERAEAPQSCPVNILPPQRDLVRERPIENAQGVPVYDNPSPSRPGAVPIWESRSSARDEARGGRLNVGPDRTVPPTHTPTHSHTHTPTRTCARAHTSHRARAHKRRRPALVARACGSVVAGVVMDAG